MFLSFTVDPGLLPIKGGGVRSLGQAGRSVGIKVHLGGKLDDGDVVVGHTILVVGVGGHVDSNLSETSLSCAGKVMLAKSDLNVNVE